MPDINSLYAHLFETLEGLKNKSIDVDHARSINETAQTIVNVAKVEVDFMKTSGQPIGSSFITALPAPANTAAADKQKTANGVRKIEQVAGGTITTHRMRG